MVDPFGFDGKRVLVVGGASGMGSAAAQIAAARGGKVTILDVREPLVEVGDFVHLDLNDKASIDSVVASLDGPIDVLLSCAGVAAGPLLPTVNFIGQRHLLEGVLGRGLIPSGGSITMISSMAGLGWQDKLETLLPLLDTPGFDEAVAWTEAHPDTPLGYLLGKQAVAAYVARRGPSLLKAGIRINAIGPAPTNTPLLANTESWQKAGESFEADMGHRAATAEEMALPLLFLASDAASFISGTFLVIDAGYSNGWQAGAVESAMLGQMISRPAAVG